MSMFVLRLSSEERVLSVDDAYGASSPAISRILAIRSRPWSSGPCSAARPRRSLGASSPLRDREERCELNHHVTNRQGGRRRTTDRPRLVFPERVDRYSSEGGP